MSFYWIKTKSFIKRLFSNYVWDLPNTQNKIYLTFDDGPTPEITEWVLEELKKHNVKATFFCIGNNIQKHPELFQKVINEGHVIGNHTYDHMNGWKTETKTYLENIRLCEKQIQKSLIENLQSKIFRPPYGKIKTAQAKIVRRLGYKIIMWDVLSADFDQTITPEKCLENVISNVKSGSVIVFHDSIKASHNLKYALPETLNFLKEKGFLFDVIK
ncbi:polysaccharide deacetylase family protein [Flavobacterium alvei]|uniref:polysaccharide deacetylase family protein n=1 Tax=Flavobacterium alvei TaxID=2080416 RepID=UPI0026F1C885|nr:polysaccharide deacetylase family protein [Flavobacterium alvei]